MSAREELAAILHDEGAYCGLCGWEEGECADCTKTLGGYADAILAAGYSKPRTIPSEHLTQASDGSYATDHRAGTIIESADGSVWRFDEGDWDCLDWASASLRGPATLIYSPEES